SKWVLKKAMQGILPGDVISRPKMGFGVPLRAWLRGPLKGMMCDLLSIGTLHKRGLFDPTAVSRLVSDNEMGLTDHAYNILSLMCIELWCQEFIDNDPGRRGSTSKAMPSESASPRMSQRSPSPSHDTRDIVPF
ncbi:MAG: asparagine synthase-related protein, partial [Candidatus Acidiferrales bacterium]